MRPAEREGRALLIEDLRVDRPLPPPFWRDFCDAAENAASPSWGRVVFVRNLGFHANLKIVKIYNLILFNF